MEPEYHAVGGEQSSLDSGKSSHIPPAVIWSIIAFVVGILFQVGTSWGSKSSEVQTLTLQVVELKGQITALHDSYTQSHEQTAVELQKIEQHLVYQDTRLDRLETKRAY